MHHEVKPLEAKSWVGARASCPLTWKSIQPGWSSCTYIQLRCVRLFHNLVGNYCRFPCAIMHTCVWCAGAPIPFLNVWTGVSCNSGHVHLTLLKVAWVSPYCRVRLIPFVGHWLEIWWNSQDEEDIWNCYWWKGCKHRVSWRFMGQTQSGV